MAINTYFQRIQTVLSDPSQEGQKTRRHLSRIASITSIAFLSLALSAAAFMMLSGYGQLFSVIASFGVGDFGVVSRNIADIIEDARPAMNPTSLVASIFKGTIYTGRLLEKFVERKLTTPLVA